MKSRVWIIFLAVSIIIPINSFAEPAPDYPGSFEYSKWVVIGNITAVEILSEPDTNRVGFALYTLDIEKYLKNPIENSTLTIFGHYYNEDIGRYPTASNLYEIDQRVLFYIQELQNIPGYDYIVRDRTSGVITEKICPENTSYQIGLCFYNDDPNKAHPPCINRTIEDCKQHRVTFSDESAPVCGTGTELIDGICQIIIAEQQKTIGTDAPFFGIFVYFEDLFSWIFGN